MRQSIAVRLSVEKLALIRSLVDLRYRLGDIPEPTASAYLRCPLTRDMEQTNREMGKVRQQVTQG